MREKEQEREVRSVKEIRESKGMSQAELGKLVGVKQSAISHYETGIRTPDFLLAKKIAEALEVSIGEIYF